MPWVVLERKENKTDVFYTKPKSSRNWKRYFEELENKRNFKDSASNNEHVIINNIGE
jgi:hypothetical protein